MSKKIIIQQFFNKNFGLRWLKKNEKNVGLLTYNRSGMPGLDRAWTCDRVEDLGVVAAVDKP